MSERDRDYKVNMTFTIPISLILWAREFAANTNTPLSHVVSQAVAEMKANRESAHGA
jgi:hypothetical protein